MNLNSAERRSTPSRDAELERIRRVYAQRECSRHSVRGPYSDISQSLRVAEIRRRVARVLARASAPPISRLKFLDVGCGEGQWLRTLASMGANEKNLTGVDLLPARLKTAKRLCSPRTALHCCDASKLPFSDADFDIALAFTLFSSILDDAFKKTVAAEMLRVLRSGGLILWHDLRVGNPLNPNVRAVPRREIANLFASCKVTIEPVTLAPPLSRLLSRSAKLHDRFSRIPMLCSHYFGVIQKP